MVLKEFCGLESDQSNINKTNHSGVLDMASMYSNTGFGNNSINLYIYIFRLYKSIAPEIFTSASDPSPKQETNIFVDFVWP